MILKSCSRKFKTSSALHGLAFVLGSTFLLIAITAPSYAYDRVELHNHTPYEAHVYVSYPGCAGDDWIAPPGKQTSDKLVPSVTHAPSKRGACLATEVKVNMRTGPNLTTYDYHSSGTSYSKFHLLRRGKHYRVMSEAEVSSRSKLKYTSTC